MYRERERKWWGENGDGEIHTILRMHHAFAPLPLNPEIL
jgi:hypothetical protein